MSIVNTVELFALSLTLFAPPALPADAGSNKVCEIRVQVPDQLSRSRIEGKILQNASRDYNIRILDWPAQYADASPPAALWYKVVRDEEGWFLIYRDVDDNELTEDQIQQTGNAIEDDISGELATLAVAACHERQNFERSVAELDAESQRTWAAPPPRSRPSQHDPIPPILPAPREGVGFLATSLSFGLAGLVLGVGGFAYAYDRRITADAQVHACQLTGVSKAECRGRGPSLMWRSRSMVGTGIGSTGAAMVGVGLMLAIPAALRLSGRRRAWESNPAISVWADRTGGGIGIGGRF